MSTCSRLCQSQTVAPNPASYARMTTWRVRARHHGGGTDDSLASFVGAIMHQTTRKQNASDIEYEEK